jgi:hypothetical protein
LKGVLVPCREAIRLVPCREAIRLVPCRRSHPAGNAAVAGHARCDCLRIARLALAVLGVL